MRFTHEGIPVKSMLVPDVEATAVPAVSGCDNFAGVTALDARALVPSVLIGIVVL
jgi:hypothetical protein